MVNIEKIYLLAKEKGISNTFICQKLNRPRSFLTDVRQGKLRISDDQLAVIADILDTTPDYLKDETDKKEKTPRKRGVKIPVFGNVAAGIPLEAIEDIEDYEEITEEMAGTGEYFALRIKGDSMMPRILSGDVIIVRKQPTVENGELAVVMVNGNEATCKKVVIGKNELSLISFNPAYDPMTFTKKEARDLPVTILGKVVELRGKF